MSKRLKDIINWVPLPPGILFIKKELKPLAPRPCTANFALFTYAIALTAVIYSWLYYSQPSQGKIVSLIQSDYQKEGYT